MTEFEAKLAECRGALERFVRFKMPSDFDADDVMQEVMIAASEGYAELRAGDSFRAWLIGIARNKCRDFYRKRAKFPEIPCDNLGGYATARNFSRNSDGGIVRETLLRLSDRDRLMLTLCYFRDLPQSEIARRLGIPLGTVKSRLHTARENFRAIYPNTQLSKGAKTMTKMPKIMPDYTITPLDRPPFEVEWEELMGWFIVPRIGEKLTWGMYDHPERCLTEWDEMAVVGAAEVHGIEGVEIEVRTHDPMECNSEGGQREVTRRFIAQLTETHTRFLAESHIRDGVKKCYTFLDGDAFHDNWGFGEDNCGNRIHLALRGDITRNGSAVFTKDKPFLIDIVGRYAVKIAGKEYDTVCVMDANTYNPGVLSEQFLDANGRTILWRRFNRDDWAVERYGGRRWSELLPENERLTLNGETYVHWYDCITDYIL